MDFEKENNLNASLIRKEIEGVSASIRELKLAAENHAHASFAPSKSSHFSSYPRQGSHSSNNNYRKRNPPSHHLKARSQAQNQNLNQFIHPATSYAMKTLSRSSSFHDDSCVESKAIEKIPSSETASVSGHSTESTHSSGSSSPVSMEIPSHSQPSQSTAYRSNEQSSQQVRRHSLNKTHTQRPSNITTSSSSTTTTTSNPYSFQPSAKDYQISQAMMLQRNQMYQTVKMDAEIVYVITQLSYQAKDYLYQQQENLTKFYEDKRVHELSRLSSARSSKTDKASEVSSSRSRSSSNTNEGKGLCK